MPDDISAKDRAWRLRHVLPSCDIAMREEIGDCTYTGTNEKERKLLTLEVPVVVDVQLSVFMPVEVVPGTVGLPPGPHVVLSAWNLVSEPT